MWSRVNKVKTINLKQIKILYVYNFVLNYITIYDFLNLKFFKIFSLQIIEFVNLKIVYLSIRVDVTFNVLLMCKKLLVTYIVIEKKQTIITSLIVWKNIRVRSKYVRSK